ncbi:MAG: adenylate/guanylate cyclase domain-containing protein [Acidimicrobiia bacterium]
MTFWDRLEQRTRASGAAETIEDPGAIVRLATGGFSGAAVNAALITTLFFSLGEPTSGWAGVALTAAYLGSWVIFAATGSLWGAFTLLAVASMANNTFVHLAMGGYANSGAYFMWGIAATVSSALVLRRPGTIAVGVFYGVLAIVFGFLEQTLQAGRPPPDPALPAILFPYILIGTLTLVVPVLVYFLGRLAAERERAESLLLNVLPESIAERLKRDPGVIADDYPACSVLFADLVGFTSHTQQVSAQELVEELNRIFSAFDGLADRHGVQKIKTLGDGYMAVAGVPIPRDDHLDVACQMALDMQKSMGRLAEDLHSDLRLRIGINTGPAVAGIIGTTRFSYDLWGDTVTTASRMESHGEAGQIQVTDAVFRAAKDRFHFAPVGTIDVKGKGPMETYTLSGRRT